DERVVPRRVLVVSRGAVGQVGTVDRRMRAGGAAERIWRAVVADQIVAHVLGVSAPVEPFRPPPSLLAVVVLLAAGEPENGSVMLMPCAPVWESRGELVADRPCASHVGRWRWKHAAVADHLTGEAALIRSVVSGHDVRETAQDRRM